MIHAQKEKEILWKETFTIDFRDNPLKNMGAELQARKRLSHETPIIPPGPLERDTPDVNVDKIRRKPDSSVLK